MSPWRTYRGPGRWWTRKWRVDCSTADYHGRAFTERGADRLGQRAWDQYLAEHA